MAQPLRAKLSLCWWKHVQVTEQVPWRTARPDSVCAWVLCNVSFFMCSDMRWFAYIATRYLVTSARVCVGEGSEFFCPDVFSFPPWGRRLSLSLSLCPHPLSSSLQCLHTATLQMISRLQYSSSFLCVPCLLSPSFLPSVCSVHSHGQFGLPVFRIRLFTCPSQVCEWFL